MNSTDLILENNAMLKVMLRNQVQVITVLDTVLEALDGKNVTDELKAIRQQIVETRMQLMEAEVGRVKLIMMRDAAKGKR